MVAAKSTGRSACATRVRDDLKVAATNAGATQEGGVNLAPTKPRTGSARQSGGNKVQPEARLMEICEGTEG